LFLFVFFHFDFSLLIFILFFVCAQTSPIKFLGWLSTLILIDYGLMA